MYYTNLQLKLVLQNCTLLIVSEYLYIPVYARTATYNSALFLDKTRSHHRFENENKIGKAKLGLHIQVDCCSEHGQSYGFLLWQSHFSVDIIVQS